MRLLEIKKPIAIFFVAVLLMGQASSIGLFLFTPKPAQAVLGITWADIPRILEQVGEAVAIRIAQQYANKYLTRFISQMTDKFKIKNFLYYDQYLTDYYLSNLILNNVSDPDLREAFDVLYRTTVSGQTGGYNDDGGGYCRGAVATNQGMCAAAGGTWSGAVDPRIALIPRLQTAVHQFYLNHGGTEPDKVYNPDASVSDREYFASFQTYFSHPESFAQQDIYTQYASAQAQANSASQLEIGVGNSIKAGRIIGGFCSTEFDTTKTQWEGEWDPVSCAKGGGVWNQSFVDQARDLISNPSGVLDNYIKGGLNSLFNTNFNTNNRWARIGTALGNFIFTQLNLNNTDGSFNEYGAAYQPSTGDVAEIKEIDLDGDGFPDGEDVGGDVAQNGNNVPDGKLASLVDICYHGGVANQFPSNNPQAASGCTPSGQVGTSPYFTPLCSAVDKTVTALKAYIEFIKRNKNQVGTDNFHNKADAALWMAKTQDVKTAFDDLVSAVASYKNVSWEPMQIKLSRMEAYIQAVWESLAEDKDLELDDEFGSIDGVDNILDYSNQFLDYLVKVKPAIGKCDNPNFAAVAAIPPPAGVVAGGGGGGGGHCSDPGDDTAKNFEGDVRSAGNAALAANPGLANSLNDTPNSKAFVSAVASQLRSMGFQASGNVLSGNGVLHTENYVAVWRSGDTTLERYEVVNHAGDADMTISAARTDDYSGDIPLDCAK